MRYFKECETQPPGPCFVLKQKRSKITFIKKNRKDPIRKIEVDDCVIKNAICCDYLVIDHHGTEHFVELKGSDVKHAIKQLESTIKKISEDPRNSLKHCFIVSRRSNIPQTSIQKSGKIFRKKYNSSLLRKKVGDEYKLS